MPKNLIVITKLFPYNFTEAFLESETPFLQEKFKKIIFMPLLKGRIRPNFSSLTVDDSYNILYSKKTIMIIRILFSFDLYQSLFFHRKSLLKKNMFIACIKQQIHMQTIKCIIKNNPSNFTENTIVYSYWFNAPVYAFLKLREKYRMKYRVVCRAHRWDVYDENGDMPYRKYCIEHVDKIFPISQDACDFLTKKYGYKDKYILSRLGVQKRNVTTKASAPFNFQVLTISQLIQRKRKCFDCICIKKSRHKYSVDAFWHRKYGKRFKNESFINRYSQHANNVYGLCTQYRNNTIHGKIYRGCFHEFKYIRRSSCIYHGSTILWYSCYSYQCWRDWRNH